MCATMPKSAITAYVNLFIIFKSPYYVSFLFNTDGLLLIFRLVALGDVNLCFSLILVTKADAVEEETKLNARLFHHNDQSMHMADDVQ
jgi:hypothetical protein